MDLENFGGRFFYFTTVPCAQMVFVSQHTSRSIKMTPVLCNLFSKPAQPDIFLQNCTEIASTWAWYWYNWAILCFRQWLLLRFTSSMVIHISGIKQQVWSDTIKSTVDLDWRGYSERHVGWWCCFSHQMCRMVWGCQEGECFPFLHSAVFFSSSFIKNVFWLC